MDETTIQYLTRYVVEQDCDRKCQGILLDAIKTCPPMTTTVYRGHRSGTTIKKTIWFSTSKSKKIAKEEFSSKDCCVFTIHLVNVPALDVYKYIPKGRMGDEEEILVLGGGTFYSDSSLKQEGFRNLGSGEFECWYTIRPERDLNAIANDLREESEFIETPEDITAFLPGLTKREQLEVFKILKGGKRRKTRRRRVKNRK
jgi:hypothetical protein